MPKPRPSFAFVLSTLRCCGLPQGQGQGPPHQRGTLAVGNYLAREFGGGSGSELQNLSFLNYLDSERAKPSDPTAASDAIAVFDDARWINAPAGESGFISAAGVPSPHRCDQVSLLNDFTYKPMPKS
jgi:hypothetical protein